MEKARVGMGASIPCALYVLIVRSVHPLGPLHLDRPCVLFSIFLRLVPPNAPISVLSTQRASPRLILSHFHMIPLPSPLLPWHTPAYS